MVREVESIDAIVSGGSAQEGSGKLPGILSAVREAGAPVTETAEEMYEQMRSSARGILSVGAFTAALVFASGCQTPGDGSDGGSFTQDSEYTCGAPESSFGSYLDVDGARRTKAHNGNDYVAPRGTVIYAMAPGVVRGLANDEVFTDNPGGHAIGIYHGEDVRPEGSGEHIWLALHHLNEVYVEHGEFVERGDPIGEVGTTGNPRNLSARRTSHVHVGLLESSSPFQMWYGSGFGGDPDESVDARNFGWNNLAFAPFVESVDYGDPKDWQTNQIFTGFTHMLPCRAEVIAEFSSRYARPTSSD